MSFNQAHGITHMLSHYVSYEKSIDLNIENKTTHNILEFKYNK